MTNPTSNFGWQMPTSTDLVTDLPADFEVFGQAVDTSLADLKGGTTGQILSKATGTDMDFAWITNDVGDITAVTAGTGISGGGTSGAVTVTNSMATAIDAKGDLIAGTGADAFSRLAVGTNGQALLANSATATGLEWGTPASGGMTLISTTTLTGASVTLSSIPQTYNNLVLVIRAYLPNTANASINLRFNGETGGSSHRQYDTSTANNNSSNLSWTSSAPITAGQSPSTTFAMSYVEFYDYTNTSTRKIARYTSIGTDNTNNSNFTLNNGNAFYNSNSAVSSIVLAPTSGNFTSGTALLYGVK
jgi:hypothetical protein